MTLVILAWAATAHAQQMPDVGQAGSRCAIPDTNFWSPPTTGAGVVDVSVEFFLLDIIEIDDRRNRFKLDFTLNFQWADTRLELMAERGEACTALLSEIWHPHFLFVNSIEEMGVYDGLVEVFAGGSVIYSKRFTREFTANMDLRHFPYDTQLLEVEIASMLYGPNDVRFAAKEDSIGALDGVSIPGWQITQLDSSVPEQPIKTKTSSHSSLSYVVHVEREYGYYLWRLVFPLIMITLMAWSVFWLEPSQLAPQITVATGAIFSLMAFLVSQGQILPTVSYISMADRLIVACVALVFLAFGEAVLTGSLSQAGKISLARKIDQVGRWAYLSAVVILVVSVI